MDPQGRCLFARKGSSGSGTHDLPMKRPLGCPTDRTGLHCLDPHVVGQEYAKDRDAFIII